MHGHTNNPGRDISDRVIGLLDDALHTLWAPPPSPQRPNPAARIAADLPPPQRGLSARLMRVDHSGEICAQALYRGQAATARRCDVRSGLERAAREETDHLAWTAERLHELGASVSVLNPLFYTGAFVIGALAGLVGDRWSLGFIAETEHQVARHLDGHLARLPPADEKSRAILVQMKTDELRHATQAVEHGGAPLPAPVPQLMHLAARVMTTTACWI
jgi:3-demethoxyubiquinol 3-hydroxylase